MAFKLDFSQVNDNNGVANGTYEAVIFNALEDASNSGTEFINFDMIIRNDIDQKYQNAHVFNRVWKSKKDNKYNGAMINRIAQAAGLDDGKTYNNLQELLEDFLDKPVRITVKNETSEYNGNTYHDLNVKRWEKTKFPEVHHQNKKPRQAKKTFTTDQPSEDTIPF